MKNPFINPGRIYFSMRKCIYIHTNNPVIYFQVSFIDSWLLSRNPIKKLLLRMMRKSYPDSTKGALQRQMVYSFGDNYYFRKELKILNLLTGYPNINFHYTRD